MMDPATNLKEMARVAKNSSTRAYAGHCQEFRQALNFGDLNLTEYARSFGIYKVVFQSMPKNNQAAQQAPEVGKKRKRKDEVSTDPLVAARQAEMEKKAALEAKESSELFTRRLQKSKLKDLEHKMRLAQQSGEDTFKIKREMDTVRKQVFTDERKLDQRKKGFERAKLNVKATVLSEFM